MPRCTLRVEICICAKYSSISPQWHGRLNRGAGLPLGNQKQRHLIMFKRLFLLIALASVATSFGHDLAAQDRVTLGWGRIFTNDQIGDGDDRWRTGSYTVSRLRGPFWSGYENARFGDVLELRGHASVIAPDNLTVPDAQDRPYAGVLSLGMHSHFGWNGNEVAFGGDLVLTGPQTGLGGFQTWFHDTLGMVPPSDAVLNAQIGNRAYPTMVAEAGRPISIGQNVQARPFVEVRAGVETLLRLGGDVMIGRFDRGGLSLRDATTGQRYRGVKGTRQDGLSLSLGADVAQVFDTALLPSTGSITASDTRYRMRAGLQWQAKGATAFYGVSYLSPEFDQQDQGQVVGALSLNLRF